MLDTRCKITLTRTEDKIHYCIEHYLDDLSPRQVKNGSVVSKNRNNQALIYFELVRAIDRSISEFINEDHNTNGKQI